MAVSSTTRDVSTRRPARPCRPAAMGPLFILLLVVLFLATGTGAVKLSPGQIAGMLASRLPVVQQWVAPTWSPAQEQILFQIRLPRVVLGALIGMSLSLAGAAFQGLFRNPMASPYVTGVSSGAGFGAALAMFFRWHGFFLGLSAVPLAAFAGGLATVALVYRLARVDGRLPVLTLLLAGIAVGSVLSAGISLLVFFSDEMVGSIVFWLMGSLSAADWARVQVMAPYAVMGSLPLLLSARGLNAMLLGEESAAYLGVDTEKLKRLLLAAASLLVGAAVAVSGIIGFVGLIVPHLARLITGPDHRVLLPASALLGAAFLVGADLIARVIIAPAQLPVGIVTALTGGPFFLFLLRRRARGG